jgi:molecular chaperone HtpG
MRMPWEQEGKSPEEIEFDCQVYLMRTMKESVLETIPVRLSGEVNAAGVLYLTRVRVFDMEAPRNVRVFQKRMFLCENVPEILPKWASFVNGVINTPDLTPTAARDNFIRNAAAERLRDVLGDLIVKHLEQVHQRDPERFSQILRYHNWGIKAACFYYREFFAKFAHLLEWRTNSGKPETRWGEFQPVWRTLPDILARLPQVQGDLQLLLCFTDLQFG